MPSDKYDLAGRVKAVEREHTALRFTTDHALRLLGEGGVELEEDLKRDCVHRCENSEQDKSSETPAIAEPMIAIRRPTSQYQ